jgi:hypothetical protein
LANNTKIKLTDFNIDSAIKTETSLLHCILNQHEKIFIIYKDPKWQAYKLAICTAIFVIIIGSLLYEFLHEVQVWIIVALAIAMVGLEKYKESQ